MKKKWIVSFLIIGTFFTYQSVTSEEKKLDIKSLIQNIDIKKESVLEENYQIKTDGITFTLEKEEEIEELAKKTTYLLLGNPNTKTSSYQEYAKRKKALLSLRYKKEIPKDENGNYIEESEEYKDDIITGFNIPTMFLNLAEKNIQYKEEGTIKIFQTDKYMVARTILKNVTFEVENEENPKEMIKEENNLILYYFYKELNGEYGLYWIMAETEENVDSYFKDTIQQEYANKIVTTTKYSSEIEEIYDNTKLESLSVKEINQVYKNNIGNVVNVNIVNGQNIESSAVGFFLSEGIVATSWTYIKNTLTSSNIVTITDKNMSSYDIDGFITANETLDIVLIKLKNQNTGKVTIGDTSSIKEEDPVILLGSKTGLNISSTTGIVISNNNTIQAMIPSTSKEAGSPLFNTKGEMVGYLQNKTTTSSISTFYPSKYLNDIKEEIENIGFENIKVISYEKLKENYKKEIKEEIESNTIPEKIWDEYKQIGNIEKTISLTLKKGSYYNNVLSLRYENISSTYFNGIASEMDSFIFVQSFLQELENDGYQEKFSSKTKKTYENDKYQIILMKEFNYIIVLMMVK